MIKFNNASLYYGNNSIIENINIDINSNECLIIRGDSGEGKSTFLDAIAGFLKPRSGTIEIDDNNIYGLTENQRTKFRKDIISYFPQNYNLIDSLRVFDNVCLPLLLSSKENNYDKIYEHVERCLKLMDIEDLMYKQPKQISGGERRRVQIARCIIDDKKYILMDEPTNGLDDNCVENLINIIHAEQDLGKTIVISTHDPRMMNIETTTVYVIKNKVLAEETKKIRYFSLCT